MIASGAIGAARANQHLRRIHPGRCRRLQRRAAFV